MPVKTNVVRSRLIGEARKELERAAGANQVVSRKEAKKLPRLLAQAVDSARAANPRVRVGDAVDAFARKVTRVLTAVDSAGKGTLTLAEARKISDLSLRARVLDVRAALLSGGLGGLPTAAEVLSALELSLGTSTPRVRGEIEVFNESGDNGVNTFAAALPGATDLDDAISMAKTEWSSWGFASWGMNVQSATPATAIKKFLTEARGLYAEEDLEPAEVDGVIQAFADRVQATFGSLKDVRLATGPTVNSERGGTYLFGKTSDGWVALAVRQYRDG